MNKSETAKVLSYILADYDAVISENLLNVWHDQFENVAYIDAMRGAKLLLSKKTFGRPKCADLHECLEAMNVKCSPEEAWGHVLKCAQSIGRYDQSKALRLLSSISPEIANAAEPIYLELCNSEQKEWSTIRAHFWKILNATQSRSKVTELQKAQDRNISHELASDTLKYSGASHKGLITFKTV